MPVTPAELRDLAQSLCTDDATECELRASISRAYYSAFHAVLPVVSDLPASKNCPEDADHVSHHEAAERLREWRVQDQYPALARLTATVSTLRQALLTAKAKRVVADYRLESTITINDAKQQIARVKQISRHASQIMTEKIAAAA